jgi:hypothetical protein
MEQGFMTQLLGGGMCLHPALNTGLGTKKAWVGRCKVPGGKKLHQ